MAPATPNRRRAADKTYAGVTAGWWKALGTALIGLAVKLAWDFTGYQLYLGEQVKAHEVRFATMEARGVERRQARDNDIQNLKERDAELQQEINTLHNDLMARTPRGRE